MGQDDDSPFKKISGAVKSNPMGHLSATEDIDAIKKGAKSALGISRFFNRDVAAWRLKKQLESEGFDPVTIAQACDAQKAGNKNQVAAILYAAKLARKAQQRNAELIKNPPPIHGDARFATQETLSHAKHLSPQDGTLSFGQHTETGAPVHWNGEGHILTLAPTRTGKSALQIIPNLLRYKGSVIVLDPKGELYQATHQWREDNVGEVFVVDPFKIVGEYSDSFNPLNLVTDDRSARKLARMIYPSTGDSKQQFFENEVIGFLSAVIEYCALYAPASWRSMSCIRDYTVSDGEELQVLLNDMLTDDLPASIKNPAKTFKGKSSDAKKRLFDSLETHMQIWDTAALREISTNTDFTFEEIKDTPSTVYLVMPFDDLTAFSTYIQAFFAAALGDMIKTQNKPDIPVLFILDEFLALDPADHFVSALRTHAGAGVRLWFFIQDLVSLQALYPDRWQSFMQAEVKVFFGTNEKETSEYISEYLGFKTETVADPSSGTMSVGGGASSYSIDQKYSYHKVALMTPDQVERFMVSHDKSGPRMGIVFMGGGIRIKTKLTPWHMIPDLKARCGISWN